MEINVDVTPKTHSHMYEGQDIGRSASAAARFLQVMGAADSDTLIITHGGKPSLRGSVGWYAKHTVQENAKVGPRVIRWKADPRFTV